MPLALPSRSRNRLVAGTSVLTLIISGVLAAPQAGAQEAEASDEQVVVDTVVLDANPATENSGSYTTDGSSGSAAGLALSVRETPQSVTVMTNQKIEDQKLQTLDEVINATPGLTAMQGNGEMRWVFYARGSAVENQQFDGVSNYLHYYSRDINPQEDMAMYDRVEVVRGATGLLEGTGSPSASVNLVRKMPTAEQQSSLETEVSSFGNLRLSYDTSGTLSKDGRLRGRFIASGLAGDGQRSNLSDDRGLLYGVLEYDLTESTTLSLGLSHAEERIDGYSWGGVWTARDGSFLGFGPRTSPSLDWEYSDREQTVGYANLSHVFDNGWTLDANLRASDGSSAMMSSYMYYNEDGDLIRSGGLYDYISKTNSLDVRLSGQANLFGRDHDFVFGVNGSRDRTRYDGSSPYSFVIADPTVADPHAELKPAATDVLYFSDMVTRNYGVYGSARWSLSDQLKFITGARLAWYDYSDESNWGPSGYKVNGEVVPYMGLVYDVNDVWTVYGSYTGIFMPQSQRGVGGQIDPVYGTNFELGAKAGLLGGDLIASAALFQTDQDGLAETDPDNVGCAGSGPTCYVNAGLIRTRGVEFELAGALSDRWNVMASFTYVDPRYREGEKSGERYNTNNMPEHLVKLSTTYDMGGAYEGLTLGGSVRYQSRTYLDGSDGDWASGYAPYYMEQDAYAVVDVMARYEINEDSTVQVNINNLFDETYYSAIASPGYGNFIGAERNVSVALTHNF